MILFDLDGTLWDAADSVAESWNIVIAEENGSGTALTGDDIRRNMGKTMNEIADDLMGYLEPDERYALARKCEVFENGFIREHGGNLYPGVTETLAKLSDAGESMAVVSNCQEGYVPAFMDSMDMWKYFGDYEEWGRTGLSKAENIRLVMERNGETEAVYVGDIQKDADSAAEAGIPCIYASYGFGTVREPAGVLGDFTELPEVLRRMRAEGKLQKETE